MYTFTFSAEHTVLIGRALDLMPMGEALPLAQYMQAEINRQATLFAEQVAAAERSKIGAVVAAAAIQSGIEMTADKPKRVRRAGAK